MLRVRPNLRAAEEKQSHSRCRASTESAANAQSSANRSSLMVERNTRFFALKCLVAMLVSLRSNRDFMLTPSVVSLNAT